MSEPPLTRDTCSHCGAELREGITLCQHCGERLEYHFRTSTSQQASSIDYIFVKIHHWSGVNLLGVLLLLIGAFGMWGGIELGDRLQSRTVGVIMLSAGVFSSAVLDIAWRLTRPKNGHANRLLNPHVGGCILYLPIWLYILAGTIFYGFIVVSRG